MTNTKNGKTLGKAALLVGSALASFSPQAAQAVTGTGTMRAFVLAPITVSNEQDLHFGSVTVATGTPGTVVVTTAGARSATAGVTLVTGTMAENEGILRITAGTGVNMDVVLQAGPFTVADTAALGADMPVDTFLFKNPAVASPFVTSIVTPATFVDVPVGATLNVAAGQTPGAYVGTYKVDVNYQ